MSGLESVEIFSDIEIATEINVDPKDLKKEITGPVFLSPSEAIAQFDIEASDAKEVEQNHALKLSQDAKSYYDSGNFDAAYEVYWQILQMNVFDQNILFEAYKNLGNIFLKDGDFDEAEELFDKACTINFKSDQLLVNYGVLEMQRMNWDKARERFRSAIEINSKSDSAWVGLALVHRECGDQDLSWANLERALDENKGNETALTIAMDWGIRDHKLDKAATRISAYISNVKDTSDMRLSLAKVLFCSGNYVAALDEAKTVVARDVQNAEALRLISVIEREVL